MLRIAEYIGGRLIDGDGARVRRGIGLLLSNANLEGFETVLLVTHEGMPLSFAEYNFILNKYVILYSCHITLSI